MDKIKKVLTENKIPIVGAALQWFITTVLQIDRAFFSYDCETKYYLIVKMLYLVFLVVAWCFCCNTYKKIKQHDSDYIRGLQVFLVCFVLQMILLLLLWPGTWAWDDLWTLERIHRYDGFHTWQHIITGIYQDIILQILPFPGGIIFFQNIFASLCIAFTVSKLERVFNIKKIKYSILDIILKTIPFFLPPIIMYQYSGYRMGLYVYLELAMLVVLICANRDMAEWSWTYVMLFCFLTVIVSTWRTESFFYVLCACVMILLVKKDIISVPKKGMCILLIICGFIGMTQWQNSELGNSNYQIISLMRPCAELVRTADYEDDAEELAAIDKVVDIVVIHNNPTVDGEGIYWNTECVRNNYTDEDYHDFLSAFVKLSLKYPQVVIAERWNLLIRGSGITGQTYTNVPAASTLFDENNGNEAANATLPNGWIANKPVFKQIRKAVINLMGGRRIDGTNVGVVQRLVWNSIIPMIFLIYAWIKLIIQKKWDLWFVCSTVIIKIPIIVLTQPSDWFMYTLSLYLLGYVYITYKIWIYYSGKKGTREYV